MFQITKDGVTRRIVDGACIPHDPRNADYRAYLEWIADGNVAEVEATPEPSPEQREKATVRDQIVSILAKPDNDVTAAEIKWLVLKMAKYIVRTGM